MQKSPEQLSIELGHCLQHLGWRIATAESCTGGGVAAAITATAGSSAWFEYGLVTYANKAKQQLLGVSQQSLDDQGAVSEPVVTEMARGAIQLSGADIVVAISGIAGPGGATPTKPVGTVWFAWLTAKGDLKTQVQHIQGDRTAVQRGAVAHALQVALDICVANTV